eukprot:1159852-Pelagomonas_calceolata.AAC.4
MSQTLCRGCYSAAQVAMMVQYSTSALLVMQQWWMCAPVFHTSPARSSSIKIWHCVNTPGLVLRILCSANHRWSSGALPLTCACACAVLRVGERQCVAYGAMYGSERLTACRAVNGSERQCMAYGAMYGLSGSAWLAYARLIPINAPQQSRAPCSVIFCGCSPRVLTATWWSLCCSNL